MLLKPEAAVSEEVLTKWAESCLHFHHHVTLIQREIRKTKQNARVYDLAERASRRAWELLNELFEHGAKKPDGYREPDAEITTTNNQLVYGEASESEQGELKRFDVELFIIHPSIKPATISTALGLEPKIAWGVGDHRKRPNGDLLEGNYPDTRWRYSERHAVRGQSFSDAVEKFVDWLMPHKEFFCELHAVRGKKSLIIQFLGDGYFGDAIPSSTLAKLAELGLDLSVECYMVRQMPL